VGAEKLREARMHVQMHARHVNKKPRLDWRGGAARRWRPPPFEPKSNANDDDGWGPEVSKSGFKRVGT